MVKYQMQKKTNAGLEMVDLTANVDKNVIIPTIEILEEIEDVVYNDETGDYVVLPVEKRLITDEEWHFFNTYLTANIRERRNANLPGSTIDDETGVCRTYIQQSMQKTLTNRKFVYTDEEKTITYTIVKEGSDYYFIKKYIYKEPIIKFKSFLEKKNLFIMKMKVMTKDYRIQNMIRQRVSAANSKYFFQLMRLTKPLFRVVNYTKNLMNAWAPMNKKYADDRDTGYTGFYQEWWRKASSSGSELYYDDKIYPKIEKINPENIFKTQVYIGMENFIEITSNTSVITVSYNVKTLASQMAYFRITDIYGDTIVLGADPSLDGYPILFPERNIVADLEYEREKYIARAIGARHPLGKASFRYKFRLLEDNGDASSTSMGGEIMFYDDEKNYDSQEFTITYKKTNELPFEAKNVLYGIEVAIKMN